MPTATTLFPPWPLHLFCYTRLLKPNVYMLTNKHTLQSSVSQSVSVAIEYGLDDQSSIPDRDRFFPSPPRPDRLWSPHALLSIGYQRLFPRGKSGRGVKMTTHLHLMLRLIVTVWSYKFSLPYIFIVWYSNTRTDEKSEHFTRICWT